MLYQETDSRLLETLRPSKLGSQTQESGGRRAVAVISQCVFTAWAQQQAGPLNTPATITAPASQVCLGNSGGHLQRSSSPPLLPPLLSHAPHCPLSASSALTSAGGLCPLLLGSWQGCGGGRGSAQEEETGNKVLPGEGAAFPRSKTRSLSLGQPSKGNNRACHFWEEVSLRRGILCLIPLPLCLVPAG